MFIRHSAPLWYIVNIIEVHHVAIFIIVAQPHIEPISMFVKGDEGVIIGWDLRAPHSAINHNQV